MCGRFILAATPAQLQRSFGLDMLPLHVTPRFNIAPGAAIWAVRAVGGLGRRLEPLQWGLIPAWARAQSIGRRLINARAETVDTKPAFRDAFAHRRCLIPADGFFEWQRQPQGKQPYRVYAEDGAPLAFAGLWEHWEEPYSGRVIESCTIITRPALPPVAAIHDRMPALLAPAAWRRWLDPEGGDRTGLKALLLGESGVALRMHPVSQEVNTPLHDNPGLIEPLPPASGPRREEES